MLSFNKIGQFYTFQTFAPKITAENYDFLYFLNISKCLVDLDSCFPGKKLFNRKLIDFIETLKHFYRTPHPINVKSLNQIK